MNCHIVNCGQALTAVFSVRTASDSEVTWTLRTYLVGAEVCPLNVPGGVSLLLNVAWSSPILNRALRCIPPQLLPPNRLSSDPSSLISQALPLPPPFPSRPTLLFPPALVLQGYISSVSADAKTRGDAPATG